MWFEQDFGGDQMQSCLTLDNKELEISFHTGNTMLHTSCRSYKDIHSQFVRNSIVKVETDLRFLRRTYFFEDGSYQLVCLERRSFDGLDVDLWSLGNFQLSVHASALLQVSYYYWLVTRDYTHKYQAFYFNPGFRMIANFETMSADELQLSAPLSYFTRCMSEIENILAVVSNTQENILVDPKDESLLCPITHCIFIDPVICTDGHTYERSAICKWLLNKTTSPMTNLPLRSTSLLPNHTVRAMCNKFINGKK